MLAEPVARPTAREVFERALWLCDTLETAPLLERSRWTSTQGFGSEGVSSDRGPVDPGELVVRIGRARSS
jgi:hypothetical protein